MTNRFGIEQRALKCIDRPHDVRPWRAGAYCNSDAYTGDFGKRTSGKPACSQVHRALASLG